MHKRHGEAGVRAHGGARLRKNLWYETAHGPATFALCAGSGGRDAVRGGTEGGYSREQNATSRSVQLGVYGSV